jgi:hypothetical protein
MKRLLVDTFVLGLCALLCLGAVVFAGKGVAPVKSVTEEQPTRLELVRVPTRLAGNTAVAETLQQLQPRSVEVNPNKVAESMLRQMTRARTLMFQGEVMKASHLLHGMAQIEVTGQDEADERVAKAYLRMADYANQLSSSPSLEMHFLQQAVRWLHPGSERPLIAQTIQRISGILDAIGETEEAARLEAMATSILRGAPVNIVDLGLRLELQSPVAEGVGSGGSDGLGPDEYEPDNDISSANRIGFRNNGVGQGNQHGRDNSQIQTHTLFPDASNLYDDIDVVKFELNRPSWVRMETSETDDPSNADTIIGLTNAGGAVLAFDDDGGDGLASKLELCLSADEWFVTSVGYYVGDTFEYDIAVDVDHSCPFETEPNVTCEAADPIGFDEVLYATHTPGFIAGDMDWFSFTVEEPTFVAIATDSTTGADTVIGLFEGCPDGLLLDSDDDGGPGFLSLIEIALEPGTYYVASLAYSASYFQAYSISVQESEPPLMESEPNNFCSEANPAALDTTVEASIDPFGDFDFFLLTVPTAQVVEIETSPLDTVMNLSSADGSTGYACDDDSGSAAFSSRIFCCLEAGDYCVGVKGWTTSTTGDYEIDFRGGIECEPLDPPVCTADGSPYGKCDPFDYRP